jgi:hypothetical protein
MNIIIKHLCLITKSVVIPASYGTVSLYDPFVFRHILKTKQKDHKELWFRSYIMYIPAKS